MVNVNEIYRHHKGELYVVKHIGVSADNATAGKWVVLYRKLLGEDDTLYSRALGEFIGKVIPGEDGPLRFELLPYASQLYAKNVGYLPQENGLFPLFSLADFPAYFAAIEELYGYCCSYDIREKLFAELKALDAADILSWSGVSSWPVAISWTGTVFRAIPLKTLQRVVNNMDKKTFLCDKQSQIMLNTTN